MSEEIAALFVSINADVSGLQAALQTTRAEVAVLGAEGGVLGTLPAQTQLQAIKMVEGVKHGLAPLPEALQNGLEGPINAALGALKGMIEGHVNGIIDLINRSIQRINTAMVGIPTPSVGASAVVPQARADGGPVNSGQPYIVGEQGPELFVPGRTGNILPNSVLGGGEGLSIRGGTFHFHGVNDVDALYDQLQRVARARS